MASESEQSPTAVIAYDQAITFADEMQLIWNRKPFFNVAFCIFIADRVFLWVYGITFVLVQCQQDLVKTRWEYTLPLLLVYISNNALWLIAAVFSALRSYAISGRNAYIATVAFCLGLGPVVIGIEVYCVVSNRDTTFGRLIFLSDVVVIVVTWHKARNFGKPIRSNYPSVITLMLCDGTLYFITMLLINIVVAVVSLVWTTEDKSPSFLVTTYINFPLGPILILRFILDLRRASTSMDLSIDDIGTSGPSASLTGSLVFNRAVDEFCAPVASLSLPSPLGEDLYMQWDETEASSEEVESDGLSGVSLPE
ncbi:hypothetical protein C8Q72DRAFT_795328 [Fomitopsis betulina]|nr:hypothetical protein C8Q72DRAFT_795328 [Fomitopsis betulina]